MKIFCIGRNYVEHAKELNSPLPENPVFFMKPETAMVRGDCTFHYPSFSKEIHHEVEIVFRICRQGKEITVEKALEYIDAVTLGLDFTARDIQQKCKEKGLPWEISKAFDQSSPLSDRFIPLSEVKNLHNIRFSMELNGKKVQEGSSAEMIFPPEKLVAYISRFITIEAGDLLYTGTPAGVGPVKPGDVLTAFMEGDRMLECRIH